MPAVVIVWIAVIVYGCVGLLQTWLHPCTHKKQPWEGRLCSACQPDPDGGWLWCIIGLFVLFLVFTG